MRFRRCTIMSVETEEANDGKISAWCKASSSRTGTLSPTNRSFMASSRWWGRGEMLTGQRDGRLVYAQRVVADRGEYSKAVMLAKYGQVPHSQQQSLGQMA